MGIEYKARWFLRENRIKLVSKNKSFIFEVEGNRIHTVIINNKGFSCDCKYWSYKQLMCSHILACFLYAKEHNLDVPDVVRC